MARVVKSSGMREGQKWKFIPRGKLQHTTLRCYSQFLLACSLGKSRLFLVGRGLPSQSRKWVSLSPTRVSQRVTHSTNVLFSLPPHVYTIFFKCLFFFFLSLGVTQWWRAPVENAQVPGGLAARLGRGVRPRRIEKLPICPKIWDFHNRRAERWRSFVVVSCNEGERLLYTPPHPRQKPGLRLPRDIYYIQCIRARTERERERESQSLQDEKIARPIHRITSAREVHASGNNNLSFFIIISQVQ